ITTRNRKREREVAGAENCHRAEGNQHSPDVRLGWFTLSRSAIDASIDPGSLSNDLGEQSPLKNRAPALRDESFSHRQGSLGGARCQQVLAQSFDLFPDAIQKRGAPLYRDLPKLAKRFGSGIKRLVDIFLRRFLKPAEITARHKGTRRRFG